MQNRHKQIQDVRGGLSLRTERPKKDIWGLEFQTKQIKRIRFKLKFKKPQNLQTKDSMSFNLSKVLDERE